MNKLKEQRLLGRVPTQLEVARALNIQPSSVSKWERGVSKPKVEKLPLLAKLYGCTVDDLLA